jgi:regulator of protease activity HflC (stomatin/prohibitin superfamily)
MEGFLIVAAMVVVFAITIIIMGVKVVPTGTAYTVERWGRYTRTLEPGLNLIIPLVDKIGGKPSLKETVLNIPSQVVISKDNAPITVDAVMYFKIVEPEKAVYRVNDLMRALENLGLTQIRNTLGTMDFDEMLSERSRINAELLSVIDEATEPWGVQVPRIELKDINPPPELEKAMQQQMTAERNKRAEILQAEGKKQASILIAEGGKEASIRLAEGEKQAEFLRAEAKERQAEADAKATKMVSEAIDQGNIQAINFQVAMKYTEALGQIAGSENSKVIMMPLEASSIIGSVGGIAELLKTTGKG